MPGKNRDDGFRKVLVVDDDLAILTMVQMVLEDEGYSVQVATDGAQALDLLESTQPELILLDMRMPGVNGWQFAELYRQMPGPYVPIVVLTAAREAAQSASDVGAKAYLPKPFDVEDLISIVSSLVSTGSR